MPRTNIFPWKSRWLTFVVATALIPWQVFGQEGGAVAVVANASGEVSVTQTATGTVSTVRIDQPLFAGDIIMTGADGRATLLLNDESLVQINRSTRLQLKSVDQSAGWLPTSADKALKSVYGLIQGELWFRNKNPDINLEIETEHVAIAVRGTEFAVRVAPGTFTEVDMLEGHIQASNAFGSIDALQGEQVYAVPGSAPVKRILLNPDDAVQWTVMLPVLTMPAGSQGVDPWVLNAWQDLQNGNVSQATAELKMLSETMPDQNFIWQAYALALLASNQPEEALVAIQTAQKTEPFNSNNFLIEAYINQALFNFNGALTAAERAVQLDPNNLTGLIKTSQLHFGLGDITTAKTYAARATEVDADDAEVLILNGYLNLAERNTSVAVTQFEAAIKRNPGLSDPQLGLGLAEMRRGNEEKALQAISTAVALAPTRSIYMSYWGRMLYQLERHDRAMQVLKRAAELDPRDPTPHYLQALVYRDTNRYGEAIEQYNQAVALNENRAVYRSRFLLDQDQAVRNIDLSIIFQEYNFSGWSNRKAVSAINQDFGNYTGHIMYANTLREENNRDVAAISEDLQSRLLKPANANSFNNFNQYTTFLDEPTLGGTAKAEYGNYDTNNYEATLFGALPDQGLAFEAGWRSIDTDGWNDSNGNDSDQWAVTAKWDPNFKDSFLFTVSDLDLTIYDNLDNRFEFDDVPDPDYRTDSDLEQYEMGYRHNFKTGMDLLISVAYVDSTTRTRDEGLVQNFRVNAGLFDVVGTTDTYFDQTNDRDSWQYQAQLNWRAADHEIIVGGYYYDGDNDIDLKQEGTINRVYEPTQPCPILCDTFTPFSRLTQNDEDRSHYSLYVHDSWSVNSWLDLEAALYYDQLRNSDPRWEGENWRLDEWNPRFGATLYASEQDIFRISAFRYRANYFSPRVSPTEMAGLTIYSNNQEAGLIKEVNLGYDRNWNTGFYLLEGFWSKGEVEGRAATLGVSGLEDLSIPPVKTEDENRRIGFRMELNQVVQQRWGIVGRFGFIDTREDLLPSSDRDEWSAEGEFTFRGYSGLGLSLQHIFRSINFDNRENSGETINTTNIKASYLFPSRNIELSTELNNIADNNFNWVTDRFDLTGQIPDRNWRARLSVSF